MSHSNSRASLREEMTRSSLRQPSCAAMAAASELLPMPLSPRTRSARDVASAVRTASTMASLNT